MLADITIQFIMIVVGIGLLGLIPVLLLNNRSSNIDENMYKKDFDAGKDLASFKADSDDDDESQRADKKVNKYKAKVD